MSEEEIKKAPKKQKSKARKIVEWVLTGLFLVLFAIVAAAQIDGMAHKKDHYGQTLKFGYGTFVVKTESMEPRYKVGSAIVTHLDSLDSIKKSFDSGKVVDLTFMDCYQPINEYTIPTTPQYTERTIATNVPMTHQLREIHINESRKVGEGKYTFIVAGINSKGVASLESQYQAFTEKELLGRVVIGSAFLGGVFSFVSSIWGLLILLLIPAFYLIITSVIDIFKAYKEPEEASEGAVEGQASAPANKENIELSEEDKKRLKEELLQEMLSKKKGDNK